MKITKVLMASAFLLIVGATHTLSANVGTNESTNESYIVRFKSSEEAKNFLNNSNFAVKAELLNEELNIYQILPAVESSRSVNALSLLRADKRVKYAQPDHKVQPRAAVVPNDLDFSKQWSLKNTVTPGADIGATEAWAYGTSGKTAAGEDIVVAVVDGGVELAHKDLKENIWVNKNEIPGNGKDDDNNGYVDDMNGWNAYTNNGNVVSNSHGTHVAGIVSAKGNNGQQVSGVNWNVKVMAVNGSSSTTSVIVKAYTYVLNQKKLWISSKGEKGANVVATNSSFGVDFGRCETGDFPVWNDMYNEMGKVGILSAAATINDSVDVDAKGDVPTSCSSNYLVTVTNTQSDDTKYASAGFGKTTIDLGAPGTAIFSTYTNNATASLTGTSMATPHVAGAIAFIYSVASPQLSELVRNDPAKGAMAVKQILLDSVEANASLKGKTVTGGRLSLKNAAEKAYNFVQ